MASLFDKAKTHPLYRRYQAAKAIVDRADDAAFNACDALGVGIFHPSVADLWERARKLARARDRYYVTVMGF